MGHAIIHISDRDHFRTPISSLKIPTPQNSDASKYKTMIDHAAHTASTLTPAPIKRFNTVQPYAPASYETGH